MSADHYWCAHAHRADNIREIDLVKVNHLRAEGQSIANACRHWRIGVKEIGAPI
jgi:hypothetical protein